MRRLTTLALLSTLSFCALGQPRGGPPRPGKVEPIQGTRIAWFATLDSARAQAQASNRPILLVAAAPHCGDVPGVW